MFDLIRDLLCRVPVVFDQDGLQVIDVSLFILACAFVKLVVFSFF